MNKDDIYKIWAPPEAVWSRWVKPVLFAFTDAAIEFPPERSAQPALGWVPPVGTSALVVDLPEDDGILWGLNLARLGYRPVPLYNALPFDTAEKTTSPSSRPASTVHVEPILATLIRETETLRQINLPHDAPPAFLLDSMRRVARPDLRAGVFDNRSICFSTDFPTAEFLLGRGIKSVIVVQESANFAPDLMEILVLWQTGGIQILRKESNDASEPISVVARRASFAKRVWFRLTVALGLRKSELGGYGTTVHASNG